MMSSVISRLNDKRDAAAELGEDAGFTLIELMVVILILAILLAIAIPTFLGVTGGANDRAAQSNLNTALTTVKAAAGINNQTYAGIPAGTFAANEPSITWCTVDPAAVVPCQTSGAVTTQGPVSWTTSADGAGIVLASFSKNSNTCFYASENEAPVTSAGWGPNAPIVAGVKYATGAPNVACDSSNLPGGLNWTSAF